MAPWTFLIGSAAKVEYGRALSDVHVLVMSGLLAPVPRADRGITTEQSDEFDIIRILGI